jgi:hypothetical protein
MDTDISHAATGFKSFLLKPLAPFFKKKNAGAVISIAVTGMPATIVFRRTLRIINSRSLNSRSLSQDVETTGVRHKSSAGTNRCFSHRHQTLQEAAASWRCHGNCGLLYA